MNKRKISNKNKILALAFSVTTLIAGSANLHALTWDKTNQECLSSHVCLRYAPSADFLNEQKKLATSNGVSEQDFTKMYNDVFDSKIPADVQKLELTDEKLQTVINNTNWWELKRTIITNVEKMIKEKNPKYEKAFIVIKDENKKDFKTLSTFLEEQFKNHFYLEIPTEDAPKNAIIGYSQINNAWITDFTSMLIHNIVNKDFEPAKGYLDAIEKMITLSKDNMTSESFNMYQSIISNLKKNVISDAENIAKETSDDQKVKPLLKLVDNVKEILYNQNSTKDNLPQGIIKYVADVKTPIASTIDSLTMSVTNGTNVIKNNISDKIDEHKTNNDYINSINKIQDEAIALSNVFDNVKSVFSGNGLPLTYRIGKIYDVMLDLLYKKIDLLKKLETKEEAKLSVAKRNTFAAKLPSLKSNIAAVNNKVDTTSKSLHSLSMNSAMNMPSLGLSSKSDLKLSTKPKLIDRLSGKHNTKKMKLSTSKPIGDKLTKNLAKGNVKALKKTSEGFNDDLSKDINYYTPIVEAIALFIGLFIIVGTMLKNSKFLFIRKFKKNHNKN